MTRRSKREIKRAIEEIDVGRSQERTTPKIEENRSEVVVEFVYDVSRDLMSISWENGDKVTNAEDPAATLNYLEIVREQYDIDDDRDEKASQRLLDVAEKLSDRTYLTFSMAPAHLAGHRDLETESGETLSELIDEGCDAKAEHLLVKESYDLFAGENGGVQETIDP
ncbi:hypothetical protein ACOJIV_22675 [Haloarcula sp. AONF1]